MLWISFSSARPNCEKSPIPVPKARIIKEFSFTRDPKNGVGNTLVTFHAENITVWDALTRILTPLDLEVAVDEAGLMTVVPKSASE